MTTDTANPDQSDIPGRFAQELISCPATIFDNVEKEMGPRPVIRRLDRGTYDLTILFTMS